MAAKLLVQSGPQMAAKLRGESLKFNSQRSCCGKLILSVATSVSFSFRRSSRGVRYGGHLGEGPAK